MGNRSQADGYDAPRKGNPMETQAASDTLAERARRLRRQGLSALGVPLGVKVLAILTILNGIGYLLSGVLSIVAPTQWEGSFAAGLVNSLFSLILAGALGALSVWCGRSLYGGSRIALDIVIGAWGATLIFNTIMALERAPPSFPSSSTAEFCST